MESQEFQTDKSCPKRELQGPRPTPLRVRKDSYKVKKPPMAPQLPQHRPMLQPQPPQQRPPPVIIYTVSPKVIHTNANDFMTLVQRLTGSSSSSSSSSSIASHISTSGAISPAARFAIMEKTNSSENQKPKLSNLGGVDGAIKDATIDPTIMDTTIDPTCFFPGILSPGPSSLPPISPNFFSGLPDQNSLSFLHDLSPIFHGNKNYYIEDTLLLSPPITFFSTPKPSITSSYSHISISGAISPAARYAVIEKTNSSENQKLKMSNLGSVDGVNNMDATTDRTGPFPGILSPGPSSLPPISPNFFSGLLDQNSLSFLHDLSPLFPGNKNYTEGTLIPTPTTYFSNPIISPTASFDLFSQFLDF